MNHNITVASSDHHPLDAAALANFVDHTLLKPEATRADVEGAVAEAVRLGAYSVCVSPSFLPLDVPLDQNGRRRIRVTTVVGFPSGKHTSQVKAVEAAQAVADGADEVDMVIDIGAARLGRFDLTAAEIAAVRAVVPGVLKVIIESAVLDDDAIVGACRAARDAGADFVKTSTGFHPAGGATVHAVSLMKATVGDDLQVKASGGIRNLADARAMISAGATRLGLSASAQILAEERGAVAGPSSDY